MAETQGGGALAGVRVLDLSRVIAAPYAAQTLGDLGAEVIKVERPCTGDDARIYGRHTLTGSDGEPTLESAFFLGMNRNKRSVTIDIATTRGQELVRRLAADSDVLIENLKVGTMKRYGLDYDSLRAINPGLVYCSLTGYGQNGPSKDLPGYDPIFQAQCGLMAMTGLPDDVPGGGPLKTGPSIVDAAAGLYATIGILAALRHRDATGEGQYLDVALLDAAIAFTTHATQEYLATGVLPRRKGNEGNGGMPSQVLPCSDGDVYVVAGNNNHFAALCRVLGLDDLIDDPRYALGRSRGEHRDALTPRLEGASRSWTAAKLARSLSEAKVPASVVNTLAETFEDAQVRHRGIAVQMPHPLKPDLLGIASPIRLQSTPPSYRRPPPMLGQHTDEALGERLGLGADELADLRAAKVI